MEKIKLIFKVKTPGSVLGIMDGDHPFIVMHTEEITNIGLPGRPHYCPMISYNNLIDVIVPFGADKDKNFVRNIESAKSIKEIQDICESWVNV